MIDDKIVWRNETRKVSDLIPYAKNPRKIDDDKLRKLKASIDEVGYAEVIAIDTDNVIVAGHMRTRALRELGRGEEVVDVRVPNRKLSEKEFERYLIQSNKVTGEWDFDVLAAEFSQEDLEMYGFDDKELAGIFGDMDKYDDFEKGSIAEKYLIPPFSVLDTRAGKWQDRKRVWLDMGIQSEKGRDNDLMGSGLVTLSAKQDTTYKTGVGLSGTSVFDPVLAEISYKWFAPKGGSIVDPFCGGSVRGIVAAKLGYRYSGTELRAEQVDANKEQGVALLTNGEPMPNWICDDALNIATHITEKHDLLFTCPPYADLEVYSDDPRDISNMEYAQFVDVYKRIIKEAASCLNDNRFAVVVVGEVRGKNGEYYNFIGDTISAFVEAGMHYYNEAILVNMIGTLPLRINKQFMSGRKIGKTHQNILMFWKGDLSKVKETVESWTIGEEIIDTNWKDTENSEVSGE